MLHSFLGKIMIMWLYILVSLLTSCAVCAQNVTEIHSVSLVNTTEVIKAPKCPGECVHIITSWLCDHVLEQASCDTEYLRCCVSEDMTYGTEVVTSPPLPEDQESVPIVITTLSPSTTLATIATVSTTTDVPSTVPSVTSSTVQNPSECTGLCVEVSNVQYCSSTQNGTSCDSKNKICCDNISTTSAPILPSCPGACVSPLFSLLCDHVAHDYHCGDGGRCCLPPPQVTTTPQPPGPCPGECIPTFLSGMCNRPSELILKTTDCYGGNICCYNPKPTTKLARPTRLPSVIPPPAPAKKIVPSATYMCPGTCIDTFLRFTCIREHVVYEGFNCTTPNTVCCAPVDDVMKFQQKTRRQPPPTFLIYSQNVTNREQTTTIKTPLSRIRNPYICGIKGTERRQGRIVGGVDSLPGEWCWQVALINSQNQYLCGGTLIGTQWVLTAAHCITNIVKNGDAIYVRAGESDLTQRSSSSTSQTKRVITTYIHHNHNSQTLDNDIALLKMQSPLELTKTVCLICLPARGVTRQAGKRCTVTGYGYQGEGGPIALKIREAQVPIVDERDCTVQINAVTEKLFVLPASSFCAGGEKGDDACQGDGGGPLVCEVDGFYELTGIVSWGFGCGRSSMPGIYVKVSSFIGWINQIVSVNNF